MCMLRHLGTNNKRKHYLIKNENIKVQKLRKSNTLQLDTISISTLQLKNKTRTKCRFGAQTVYNQQLSQSKQHNSSPNYDRSNQNNQTHNKINSISETSTTHHATKMIIRCHALIILNKIILYEYMSRN